MIRLNLMLLLAVITSAFYLVLTQYESRRLYAELEKANGQFTRLGIDNERLQVEKRGQATPLRVEKLAKDKLQMRTVTPAITQYVSTGAEGALIRSVQTSSPAQAGAEVSKTGASGSVQALP